MPSDLMRTAILGAVALLVTGASLGAVAQSSVPTIGQKDRVFSQESATLAAGGKLRFVNDDTVAHNVMVREPGGSSRASVLQRPGEETLVSFDSAGVYDVRCAIHPRMRMTVTAQ